MRCQDLHLESSKTGVPSCEHVEIFNRSFPVMIVMVHSLTFFGCFSVSNVYRTSVFCTVHDNLNSK